MDWVREESFTKVAALVTAEPEQCVLVVGDSGMGKTRFARILADGVELPGALVTATSAERTWPYAGVFAVLAALSEPRVAQAVQVAVRGRDATPFAVGKLVLAQLHQFPQPAQCLIVDDAHLLDPESRKVLGYLARRLRGTRLRLVLALRSLGDDGAFDGLEHVELAPLDYARTVSLVRSEAGPDTRAAVVELVAMHAEGHPRRAVEILRRLGHSQLTGSDALTFPLRMGPNTERAVRQQLGELDEDSARALAALSTRRVHPVAVLPQGGRDYAGLVARGLARVKVDQIWIAEPVVRSVVYWSMSATERRDLHAEFAACCAADESSRTWHASFVDISDEWGRQLQVMAIALTREGDFDTALEVAERSVLLGVPDDDGHQYLALANGFFYECAFGLAERYADLADASNLGPAARLRLVSLRVRFEYLRTQNVLSALAADAVRRFAGDAPDDAVLLLALLAIYCAERWELDAAVRHLDALPPWLARASEESIAIGTVARALTTAMTSGRTDLPAPELRGTIGDHTVATTTLLSHGRALTYAERYGQARHLFDMLLSNQVSLDPLWLVTTRLYSVENDRLAANFHAALATMSAVVHDDRTKDLHRPFRALHELWYWTELGDPDQAADVLERVHAHGRHNVAISARADAYLGSRALHAGDLDQAVRLLMRSKVECAHMLNPALHRIDGDLIEALVRSGDLRGARAVADNLAERAARVPSRWAASVLKRARALTTTGDESIRLFDDAVGSFNPVDSEYEQARTLAAYARALEGGGSEELQRQTAASAAALFSRMGLPWWAEQVGAPTGEPPDPQLTADESRVVELVVGGMRNRDVAQELFVSVRSVEARLTAIYRKVGVRSRAELVTWTHGSN